MVSKYRIQINTLISGLLSLRNKLMNKGEIMANIDDLEASPVVTDSFAEFTDKMGKETKRLEKDFNNKIINAREEFMKQIINLSNTVDDNYNRTNDRVKAMNKHLDNWVDDVYTKNLLLEAKIQRLIISNIISLIIGVCAILLALY